LLGPGEFSELAPPLLTAERLQNTHCLLPCVLAKLFNWFYCMIDRGIDV